MSDPKSDPKNIISSPAYLHVRGHQATRIPAPLASRALSLVVDLSLVLALAFLVIRVLGVSPLPTRAHWVLAGGTFAAILIAQRRFLGATIGQMAWKLTARGLGVYAQSARMTVQELGTAILLTSISIAVLTWSAHQALDRYPLLARGESWELEPYAPDAQAVAVDGWTIYPYFYSLGAWPARFSGKPVFHSIPYEKGPPDRFVGRIIARWEMPDIRVTLEGPKTPIAPNEILPLHGCLSRNWSEAPAPGVLACLSLRKRALERHIGEMSRALDSPSAEHWTIRWFRVENRLLSEADRVQGVYLSATGKRHAQDRFILITGQGNHQTFILDRPLSETGGLAKMMFEQAIRSQRSLGALGDGRAWINRKLAGIKLNSIEKIKDTPTHLAQIASVQSALISKISVDPKTFEAWYHLGGSAVLLAKLANREKNSDWSAIARPLIQTATRFAQDVDPEDGRIRQLRDMLTDIKRY